MAFVRVVDGEGSRWQVHRRWLPWRRRCRIGNRLDGISSPGVSDLVDVAVLLIILAVIVVPALVEIVVELLAMPVVLAFRRWGSTPTAVAVYCTARATGFADDGRVLLHDRGTFESWQTTVIGFGRAGGLVDAMAEAIRTSGRSTDFDAVAGAWSVAC